MSRQHITDHTAHLRAVPFIHSYKALLSVFRALLTVSRALLPCKPQGSLESSAPYTLEQGSFERNLGSFESLHYAVYKALLRDSIMV